jgi:hypothetical protein
MTRALRLSACWLALLQSLPAVGAAAPPVGEAPAGTQCSDTLDNGGNGWIDMADPYCRAPLDDDELSFSSGVAGDDGCSRHACCDIDGPCPADLRPDLYVPANCPQNAGCIDFCAPLAREGCDCYGCCDVCIPGTANCRTVYLHPAISPACTLEALDDPLACRPCVRDTACAGPVVHLFSDDFETGSTTRWSATVG